MASRGGYVSSLKVRPFDPPLPVLATGDIRIESLRPANDPKSAVDRQRYAPETAVPKPAVHSGRQASRWRRG